MARPTDINEPFVALIVEALKKVRGPQGLTKIEMERIDSFRNSPPDEVLAILVALGELITKHVLSVKDALNLGLLVYASNPYKTTQPNEPFGFELELDDVELQERPGTWKFKYGERYVQRAIRVPYCYTPATMKDIRPLPFVNPAPQSFMIRDHFLIGFEGGAGY